MRLSRYFIPFLKDTTSDVLSISHRLMLRTGMIRQVAGGIYNWLPIGYKVLQNVSNIIRDEMNAAGALEIAMPYVQPAELWRKSGRLEGNALSVELLKFQDKHENLLIVAPTAEEVVCDIAAQNFFSYKDLPCHLYQIGTKFRDEIRPRFGVMRGREFLMKDSYSFDADHEHAMETYCMMLNVYHRIFRRLGLSAIPVAADSGAIGGDYNHEFHVLADTGESDIFYDKGLEEYLRQDRLDINAFSKFYAVEKERHSNETCPIPVSQLQVKKGIEVGHTFYLGQKYSLSMNIRVQDQSNKFINPYMGTYGIGVSRVVAAIIEASHDENGIIWPESVAPFGFGLLNLKVGDSDCDRVCTQIYDMLISSGYSVLYDDTKDSPGAKFAKFDLLGLPWQIIVGSTRAQQNVCQLKKRSEDAPKDLEVDLLLHELKARCFVK
ncbi:proline--tRNA ligase [Rickettsiales endosymbiont of Peranema trichophorum]|uniref:proline--tRNA ligase n=1 Tax=Rickettsiales endosymbiont of Peranema trichophorum TaxID=2486577 RepID=UPI0010236FEB|nr:proline--tRNA ligase [Rickettsiales endosymbiont of Peranema trichophorum]RZI47327.1 proline--tRNA ligase [Rickettsiales endosymbiont of Peranema trichophorum]